MKIIKLCRSLAFSICFIAASLQAQTNHRGESFPEQNLPRLGRSQQIAGLLGDRLEEVASWYDQSADELRELCQKDKSLCSDRQGRLHFICAGLLPLQAAAANATTASGGTTAAAITATDAFALHSRPGASKVIYLDFDGHTTSGTSWNTSYTAGASIVTPPYLHLPMTTAAVEAGKHVICEKPVVGSLADCDVLIGAERAPSAGAESDEELNALIRATCYTLRIQICVEAFELRPVRQRQFRDVKAKALAQLPDQPGKRGWDEGNLSLFHRETVEAIDHGGCDQIALPRQDQIVGR